MRLTEIKQVKTIKGLDQENFRRLEARGLAILRWQDGACKIIKESGLGSGIDREFKSIEELNEYVAKTFWR